MRRDTPGFAAGFNAEDEILAVGGFRVRSDQWDTRLESYKPGETVDVLVSRRDRLVTLRATFAKEPLVRKLEVLKEATDEQKQRLLAWLGGPRQNLDRIGPVAIVAALWLAAAIALLWALRHAPPFSWGRVCLRPTWPSTTSCCSGVLLTGAALAYLEVQFTPLGAAWSAHFLVMSLFAGALAVRGDSRMVAGIALSTFAAWRGVAASPLERAFWTSGGATGPLRLNAVRDRAFSSWASAWWLVRTPAEGPLRAGGDAPGLAPDPGRRSSPAWARVESGTGFRLALLVGGCWPRRVQPFRRGPLPALRHRASSPPTSA